MLDFAKPEYLYRLARSGSPRDREQLALAMKDMLSTPYREVAQEILMMLLKEAEHDLRLTLAQKLSAQKDCPFELIHFLIYDNPVSIAEVALKNCPLLTDEELLKVADTFSKDPHYMQAIAQRDNLSPTVAANLLEREDDKTQILLLQNKGTQLNERSMTYLVDAVKRKPGLQQPFLQRKEVTPAVAAQVYWHVSTELRQYILGHFAIDAARLDRAMEQSVQQHVDAKAGKVVLHDDARARAERMHAIGSLNVKNTMDALRKGDVPLFICMMALITRVNPESLLRALLAEDNNEALSVLAHALRLNRTDFNGLYLLWRRQTHAAQKVIYEKDMDNAMTSFGNLTGHRMQDVLRQWRGLNQ